MQTFDPQIPSLNVIGTSVLKKWDKVLRFIFNFFNCNFFLVHFQVVHMLEYHIFKEFFSKLEEFPNGVEDFKPGWHILIYLLLISAHDYPPYQNN